MKTRITIETITEGNSDYWTKYEIEHKHVENMLRRDLGLPIEAKVIVEFS